MTSRVLRTLGEGAASCSIVQHIGAGGRGVVRYALRLYDGLTVEDGIVSAGEATRRAKRRLRRAA